MTDHILNRKTGQVALPEAGEGAFIQFDVEALEKLEGSMGDDYIDAIMKDLSKVKISTYAKVMAATLHESKNGAMPYGLTWEELNIRILDSMFLSIHGRTYEEQQEFSQEQMLKRVKGIEENPQLAALLSLMSAGTPEQEPGSPQEKSAA